MSPGPSPFPKGIYLIRPFCPQMEVTSETTLFAVYDFLVLPLKSFLLPFGALLYLLGGMLLDP